MLTFNPGWNQNGEHLYPFLYIREIQRKLKTLGIAVVAETDESSAGPSSFTILDPDGNQIPTDQYR